MFDLKFIILFVTLVVILFLFKKPLTLNEQKRKEKKLVIGKNTKSIKFTINYINNILLLLMYRNTYIISKRVGVGIASENQPPNKMFKWEVIIKLENFIITYYRDIRGSLVTIEYSKEIILEYACQTKQYSCLGINYVDLFKDGGLDNIINNKELLDKCLDELKMFEESINKEYSIEDY